MSEDCVFCRIVQRQAPACIISEDEQVISFLSLENHPLIVPKRHIPDIYSLDEATGAHIMSAAIEVARAVKEGLACEGIYLTQANEPAAGQDVFHFHLHIVPRFVNDAITLAWDNTVAERARLDSLAEEIRRCVNNEH